MKRILSIGNSFSQDAHRWLHQVCGSVGEEVLCANLYIGGCPLEVHWSNFCSHEENYDYEINGKFTRRISLNEALLKEKWDIITFQQVSGLSGIPQSYIPFLQKLAQGVRESCPDAEFYIHETWSYEIDSAHPDFANYNCSQKEMYRRLKDCYLMASKLIDAKIIPTGTVIQYLRENCPEFDYKNGGMSLNRDGFHLSLGYGRLAAALVWYAVLFGGDVRRVSFIPENNGINSNKAVTEKIKQAVFECLC